MQKLVFLLSCMIACNLLHAQNSFPNADTTTRPDSVVTEELKDNVLDNIPTITLSDDELGDVGAQNISSQLTAGRDPFYNAASFNFSPARFRIRGYDAD